MKTLTQDELLKRWPTEEARAELWSYVAITVRQVELHGEELGPVARALSFPGVVQQLENMLVARVQAAAAGGEPVGDVDEAVSVARFVRYAGGGARYNRALTEALGGDPNVCALCDILDRAATA